MSRTEAANGSGAGARLLMALLLAAWIGGLALVHVKVARPDAERYQALVAARAGLSGSGEIVSLPPRIADVLEANRLPSEAGAGSASTEFLETMSQRASRAKLRLESITPGVHEEAAGRVRIQAELHMTGGYVNLDHLLRDLARSPELIAVDYLHVTRDTEHERGLVIEMWVSRLFLNPEIVQ